MWCLVVTKYEQTVNTVDITSCNSLTNIPATLSEFKMFIPFAALIHEKSVGAMLSSKDSEFERLTKENMSTIGSYGDNLMQIVSRDACDGHNVGRVYISDIVNGA